MRKQSCVRITSPQPTNERAIKQMEEKKVCSVCSRELPLSEFYSCGKNGKLRAECKSCHRKYVSDMYAKRESEINEVKSSIGCAKCGDCRPYVLDFHHINPRTKKRGVARYVANCNNMSDIEKEIGKCVVLCANCHREFHYLQKKNGITFDEYLKK